MNLSDITSAAWHPIAYRVAGVENDEWDWMLSHHERSVFFMAREQGGILSAQKRGADGVMVLVARRARPAASARITHVRPIGWDRQA